MKRNEGGMRRKEEERGGMRRNEGGRIVKKIE